MTTKILDDVLIEITLDKNMILEERIQLVLAPKPIFLPKFVYHYLVSKLLVVHRSVV